VHDVPCGFAPAGERGDGDEREGGGEETEKSEGEPEQPGRGRALFTGPQFREARHLSLAHV
jgi:hypothetical protein